MQTSRNRLPLGRYYLPQEAVKRREVERKIVARFEAEGYTEVIPPALVSAETGVTDLDQALREKGLRIIGRGGDLLALRTDFTVPIASLASAYLIPKGLPQRLYYTGSVFRTAPGTGEVEEFWQAGVELIGPSGSSTDAGVLALAAESLLAAGVRRFHIGVGFAGLLKGILDASGSSPEQRETLTYALASGNYVDYRTIVNRFRWPSATRDVLLSLPSLRGGPAILDSIPLSVLGDEGLQAVKYLKNVFHQIHEMGLGDKVYADLGLTRKFGYYTGIVFEGYVPGAGRAVVGGGRYDRLLASFGIDVPATGFAIEIDRVVSAMVADSEGVY